MTGLRARVRAEITSEIKRLAREQLATVGAPNLSLRAIARDLEMASSAIYRYFATRDDLLTALLVDAYDGLGDAVEAADASVRSGDARTRFVTVSHAARRWAIDHPAEYGLLYGTPVPGYAAPPDTIGPASRFGAVLLGIGADAERAGLKLPAHRRPSAASVHHDLTRLAAQGGFQVDPELFAIGIHLWISLVGTISFLLHGHLHNVIDDQDAFWASTVEQLADELFGSGLDRSEPARRLHARGTGRAGRDVERSMTAHTPTPLSTAAALRTPGFSRRRLLATFAAGPALALLVAACGERADDAGSSGTTPGTAPVTTPEPTTPPIDTTGGSSVAYPTAADAVVLRLGYEGGFVPAGTAFVNLPTLLITGDGRVITQAPVTAQYPGPLVAPLEVRTISPEGIEVLLRLADDSGLLGEIPDYTGETNIADAPNTVVSLQTDTGTYTHSAYALGIASDAAGNPTDESTPARQALADFVAQVTDLEATVGAGELGSSSLLEPSAYRLQSSVVDEATLGGYDVEPTLVDWPATTGLALADATTCAVLTAEAAGGVFDGATSLTFFRDGDALYSLAVAVQLPGDPACAPMG